MEPKLLLLLLLNGFSVYSQSGEWTWMNGDSIANAAAVYGTKGVFDPANTPRGCYEACEWTDSQGNFWLFSGLGIGGWGSDLWKFDPVINQWAWMHGPGVPNQPGVYGVQGVPSTLNNPGSRGQGVPTWVDGDNNLWLFGGGGNIYHNDLWKYSISTNEWTWMKGDTSYVMGIYGTKGVENILNNPGARGECNATWIEENSNLWLFGGGGYGSLAAGSLSDLWKYNLSTNAWTWVSGPDIPDQPSIYGTQGVPHPLNIPCARWVYSKWKDRNGDLWLFGGYGYESQIVYKNDMWRYNIATNEWTWMSGSNLDNNLGAGDTMCIPKTVNSPGGKFESRACWTLPCDNFIIFGGSHNGTLHVYNDLWNYNVSTNAWTWMYGNRFAWQSPSNYGIKTVSSPTNFPSPRMGSVGWKDKAGNLWMFGSYSFTNDMWRYVPDTTCPFVCSNIGISELSDNNEIKIFPNPTTGVINIVASKSLEKCNIKIIDMLGREFYSDKFCGIEKKINFTGNKGFYMVEVTNGITTWIGKLLIE